MGIAYRCDQKTKLSVSVWDGEVTPDDCARHMAALGADPDWGQRGRVLTDLTGISAARRPSAKEVLEAAAEFSEKLADQVRNAQWAIVAGETFVLAQRFGAYLEEEVRRLIVFNDLDTACTWLGVDAADARELIGELREHLRHPDTSTQTPTPRT
jgi:hypothetical protein